MLVHQVPVQDLAHSWDWVSPVLVQVPVHDLAHSCDWVSTVLLQFPIQDVALLAVAQPARVALLAVAQPAQPGDARPLAHPPQRCD